MALRSILWTSITLFPFHKAAEVNIALHKLGFLCIYPIIIPMLIVIRGVATIEATEAAASPKNYY